MRSGDPGWEISANGEGDSWAAGGAIAGGWVKGPGMTWGTPFSCFRFAVPELMNFQGKAIYLDADMLLLADIGELFDLDIASDHGIKCFSQSRTDVTLYDCAWFKNKDWWPSLSRMKKVKARVFEYVRLLQQWKALDSTLSSDWNDVDGRMYDVTPDDVKLIHYSHVMVGQPWRPYDNVTYPDTWPYVRTSYKAAEKWFDYENEMKEIAK